MRRGKYLVFALRGKKPAGDFTLLGHLGMSGRIYLIPRGTELAKHAAVVLDLGKHQFVYEDARYFGRFTLDARPIEKLGPEPTDPAFSAAYLGRKLETLKPAGKSQIAGSNPGCGRGKYLCQ